MSTTEQTQTSKDKGVIQVIGFKEFSSICDEYQIVEKATKKLLDIANDIETPVRTRVDIYKWVVEMNIGKPKQMNDIVVSGTTKPEVSFDIFNPKTYELDMDTKDDNKNELVVSYTTTKNDLDALEQLKKELLSKGITEQQMEQKLKGNRLTEEQASEVYDSEDAKRVLGKSINERGDDYGYIEHTFSI